MSALGLGSYDSEASSDDEDAPTGPPQLLAPPVEGEDAEEEEEEEESEEEEEPEEPAAAEAEAAPVVPLALSGAVEEEEEDDDDGDVGPEEDEDEGRPSALPPPDFGDWDPSAGGGGGSQAVGPRVTALGKREKPKGGPHQISRGFSAAVTRHDQLKAKAEADLAEAAEVRGRNNGLSSAYDSVFHVPESEMTEDELDRRKRMRTTKKGGVRMISKKEAAREAALEASLM